MLIGDVCGSTTTATSRVVGRTSDFIIRGGKNISAPAVEDEVGEHPAVALAAAVAVPDALVRRAGVRLRRAATRDAALTLDELVAHLADAGCRKEMVARAPRRGRRPAPRVGRQGRQGRAARGHHPAAGAMTRVAVLDDYQDVATSIVEWPAALEVVSFTDHVDDPDELVERLRGYDVVVAMRERTRVPAGAARAAARPSAARHDRAAQRGHRRRRRRRAGHRGLRHVGDRQQHGRADVGAHPRGGPPAAGRGRLGAGRRLADGRRRRPRRPDARAPRPRQHRLPGGTGRAGLRHGRGRLERQPDRRTGRRARRPARRARTSSSPPRTSSASTSCSPSAPATSSAGPSSLA